MKIRPWTLNVAHFNDSQQKNASGQKEKQWFVGIIVGIRRATRVHQNLPHFLHGMMHFKIENHVESLSHSESSRARWNVPQVEHILINLRWGLSCPWMQNAWTSCMSLTFIFFFFFFFSNFYFRIFEEKL